jgi:hypothetical protein
MVLVEYETVPVTINGKKAAAVTVMYSNGGWSAQLMVNDNDSEIFVLGKGDDLINKEKAIDIALTYATRWRDAQRT